MLLDAETRRRGGSGDHRTLARGRGVILEGGRAAMADLDWSQCPAVESELLRAGGIYHDVPGATKEDALRSFVACLPLPPEQDREFLLEVLVAREALSSTGIGDGIAIPHVRNPILLHVDHPFVAL